MPTTRTQQLLWRWRRSPLRCRAHVAEACVRLATVAALLVGAPAAGAGFGLLVHEHLLRTAERQAAEQRSTTAVLLEDSPEATSDSELALGGDGGTFGVSVRWTAPDGSPGTGTVRVAPGLAAGSTTTVRLDRDGGLVARPPLNAAEIQAQAVTLGVTGALVTSAVLLVAGLATRARLERGRFDAWEAAWAAAEPRWSNRLL